MQNITRSEVQTQKILLALHGLTFESVIAEKTARTYSKKAESFWMIVNVIFVVVTIVSYLVK